MEIGGRMLILILVVVLGSLFPMIFLIDWLDENVVNPRIWHDWTCAQMRNFAIAGGDEDWSDFQRARFHEDLSQCLSS